MQEVWYLKLNSYQIQFEHSDSRYEPGACVLRGFRKIYTNENGRETRAMHGWRRTIGFLFGVHLFVRLKGAALRF